ncbi:MAG TPA: NHLP leader peptide family RiPP precursor [Thermoanaerobaculia bacterium]|nr:NHLP leader peptide family RiPP precursor [Thermoanaerobaculia bacterium]
MAEISRGEMQDLLTKFAVNSPKYRDALLRNPKDILEKQFNKQLPATLKVKAVEDTADTVYVVVPFVPKSGQELSDSSLESVAGGFKDNNCSSAKGGVNTFVQLNLG